MADPAQHRIYLGRAHEGADLEAAHRHWRHRHSRVVRGMPLLGGYVQNRPLPQYWGTLPFLVCAETWFASREDEQAAYASDYYRDVIAVDELDVITPEGAWNAAVGSVEELRGGERTGYRVLAFDRRDGLPALDAFGRVEVLHLRRAAPDGKNTELLSAWTSDAGAAVRLASELGGLSFACEPAAIVVPSDGWRPCASHDGTDADPETRP